MLQLVAAGRGVSVLPDWLIREDAHDMPISMLRIGKAGLHKSINLGTRRQDFQSDYVSAFFEMALRVGPTHSLT
ncbi:LysR substrate-binding domain-containing protein [Aestuariibius sp. HNIBRBA575]|uniref:LysR substrate-binding domain-containing protein n=1 Tax=Aestuariibius sp. HNIBRBA575 TaxID=3233343 RepID=UPI0034A5768F